MAISFVAATEANPAAAGTTITINVPAGVAANDLLIAAIQYQNATTMTLPSGWNVWHSSTQTSLCVQTFWRIATGSEPASYTFTIPTSVRNSGEMVAFRGADTTTPEDVTSAAVTANTSSQALFTATYPIGAEVGTPGMWVVAIAAHVTGSGETNPVWSTTNLTAVVVDACSTVAGTANVTGAIGYYTGWTSGTFRPAMSSTLTTARSTSISSAIRPAPPQPALTQAAYRFYDDGTETGSTALAAQDTAATADLTSGDVNLGIRVRLQETNAVAAPATDDWQLQWEKNTSGTWTNASTIAAEYATAVNPTAVFSTGPTQKLGQSFLGNGGQLTQAAFQLSKAASPTGNVVVELFAHSGTFGSTGVPTGTALATATPRAASTLNTTAQWETFDFDGTYTLTNGTPYFIVWGLSTAVGQVNGNSDNDGTYAGNWATLSGSWAADATDDMLFRVYTPGATVGPYVSANLTDAAATTNRLGSGSGSFVAGKVSEDGLVDNLGWTASNYTELLYSITLKQADLANGDVLKFRVLRNGATTGLTYTQTPTINVTVGAGVPSGTGTGTYLWARTTATGIVVKSGTTSGAYAWNRTTATGAKTPRGTAAGAYAYAGTATGLTPTIGPKTGTAVGTYAFNRTAAIGATEKRATATGTYNWSGTAVGTAPAVGAKTGTAVGAYLWARTSATGAKTIAGAATGSYAFNRTTATGSKAPRGTATGSYAYAGTAAGTRTQRGTGTGSYAFNRTAATGTRTPKATAVGAYLWSGVGAGKKTPRGTTTGTYNYSGTAQGFRPSIGGATGIALGGYAFDRTTVTGVTPRRGSATGTWTWARTTATGSRPAKATAVGSYAWNRTTAVGSITRRGQASGAYLYVGTAAGLTPQAAGYVEDFAGHPAQAWAGGIRYPIQTF